MFGFRNPDLNNIALTAPTESFKVNNKAGNKDSFRRDNSQNFTVIILSSINDKVNEVEENDTSPQWAFSKTN